MWREACVAVLCAVVGGYAGTACHTPNRSPIQDPSARSEVLAVLPFAAHLGVRRGAGEWFAHKMQTSARYRVIGKTTKYELLETLGMPVSIAKKGETLLIPRGVEFSATGAGVRGLRFESASGDAFFEAFSDRATGAQHRVYYYYYTTSGKRSSSKISSSALVL